MGKQSTKRDFCAQTDGHNVTPALAEYGIAKKFMEGGPQELTALDVIKCALSVVIFLLACYYGGVQYGR